MLIKSFLFLAICFIDKMSKNKDEIYQQIAEK